MMASNPVKRYWTVEEYLAHEEQTGIKHEFIDGEIYAMTGGTDKHSRIKAKVLLAIGKQLEKSKTCSFYDSDMRIKISDMRYVYADMSVVCGEPKFADKKRTKLMNPTMVVEVLSPSSANYDRGDKANFYRSLDSVQAILLLAQDQAFAQLYTRHESGWLLREYTSLEAIVPLEAIGCELALSEAYLNIDFSAEEAEDEE